MCLKIKKNIAEKMISIELALFHSSATCSCNQTGTRVRIYADRNTHRHVKQVEKCFASESQSEKENELSVCIHMEEQHSLDSRPLQITEDTAEQFISNTTKR